MSLVVAAAVLVCQGPFVSEAGANHTKPRVAGAKMHHCTRAKHKRVCRWRNHRLAKIRPYVYTFLGPVGACESGTGSHNLRVGLGIDDPYGKYHGRYQFGLPDYARAGGSGDPHNVGWLEQAYRAVLWLHINGRSSWPNC